MANMNEQDNRLSMEQVADILQVHPQTLRNWRNTGQHGESLHIYKGGNGRLFCLRENVEKFRQIYLYGEAAETQQQNGGAGK